MNPTLFIEGQPSGFEAVTPNLVGFLFGTNSYLFNIALDETQQSNIKIKQKTVSVRFDTFLRCASIEDFHVVVEGSFDKDKIFRAQAIEVKDTDIRLSGALRLSPVLAFILLVLIPTAVVTLFFVYGNFLFSTFTEVANALLPGWHVTVWEKSVHFGTIIGVFLFLVLVLPALIFLSRTVLPSFLEPVVRLLDRLSSY